MQRIGIRNLRNDVAAVVRRASAGERIVVTVDGEPVAQLGPLEPTGNPTLDDLAAAGMVRLANRTDRPAAPQPFAVAVDIRPASILAEIRGQPG